MSRALRLPFAPDPVTGESFSGWLGRLARLYAGSAQALLRRLGLDAAYDGDRPHQTTVTGLAEACGLDPRHLEVMTLGRETFRDPALSRRLALSMPPQRLGPFLLFDGRRRFCPACLDAADPIWPLVWRAGLPICLRHRVWLERACGRCGTALPSLGPEPPTRCAVCFTPFRTTPPDPAPYTPLLTDLGERIAARSQATAARDWADLGQQARNFVTGRGRCEDRTIFAEFLAWAERCDVRLPPAVLATPRSVEPTDQKAPSPTKMVARTKPATSQRSDLFSDLRRSSIQAVTEARRQLIAEGQGITERAWRRRADRLLREASRARDGGPSVNGSAGRFPRSPVPVHA